ncbi:hypothetical protein ASG14_13155 [Pedobacter sp. Leaf194]|nr:hypothetical protein ASG14_13155 [Pedobacter sp. Leaf194]
MTGNFEAVSDCVRINSGFNSRRIYLILRIRINKLPHIKMALRFTMQGVFNAFLAQTSIVFC